MHENSSFRFVSWGGFVVALYIDTLEAICIRFLLTYFAKKMFAARLKSATPILVAGLAGAATLCGYQTRYSTGKQQTFCLA